MQLEVHGRNVGITSSLGQYTQEHIGRALDHFDQRIQRVVVRLSDVNGPRGGVDKQCRVMVEMGRNGRVILDQKDVDAYAAVDSAAERAKRAVRRQLNRRKPRWA